MTENPSSLGIISDIHGNLEALEAVLAALDAEGVGKIVCCGDLVGYGANPNECIALVRSRAIPSIMGNHDAAVLSDAEIEYFNEMARTALLWTRDQLTDENRRYLASLPMTYRDAGCLFVHASPKEPELWHYVLTYGEARAAFAYFDERICFIGHSHQPFILGLRDRDLSHIRAGQVDIDPDVRYLINVGSVGQPRDRDPRACFAIYDLEAGRLTLRRVGYDIASAQAKIRESGVHQELAERLAYGY